MALTQALHNNTDKTLRFSLIAILALLLTGCVAADPTLTKLTSKLKEGSDRSKKMSLASASGLAVSGTAKIKFNIGYAPSGDTDSDPSTNDNQVISGTTKLRASAAGVLNGQ